MLSRIPAWTLIGIIILAFCVGMVNAIALLGVGNFAISHMTGTASLFSISLASFNAAAIMHTFLILASFFAGAVFSGFIIRGRSLYFGRRYGVALMIESFFILFAAFSYPHLIRLAEMSAAFACGLQNAMVTTYSGSIIRTTHLTGLITDLGSSIGNWIARIPVNFIQIKMQSTIFLSFIIGAVFGAKFFLALNYYGLFIPGIIIFVTGLMYTWWRMKRTKKKKQKAVRNLKNDLA